MHLKVHSWCNYNPAACHLHSPSGIGPLTVLVRDMLSQSIRLIWALDLSYSVTYRGLVQPWSWQWSTLCDSDATTALPFAKFCALTQAKIAGSLLGIHDYILQTTCSPKCRICDCAYCAIHGRHTRNDFKMSETLINLRGDDFDFGECATHPVNALRCSNQGQEKDIVLCYPALQQHLEYQLRRMSFSVHGPFIWLLSILYAISPGACIPVKPIE